MFKNIASQKIAVYAWDGANGCAKTGDAANITAQISKDGAASAASNDTNPTELDATDHPGIYIFDLLQAETNCDLFVLTPDSSTTDIVFRPTIKDTDLVTPTKAGYLDHSIATVDGIVDTLPTSQTLNAHIITLPTSQELNSHIITLPTSGELNDHIVTLPNSQTIMDAIGSMDIRVSSLFYTEIESGYPFIEKQRIDMSVFTGITSGGGSSTLLFRDISDSKNRLVVTVDSDGNRTAVNTLDGS